MRQSVAVARAVAFASNVIFMDEPTAALGVVQRGKVLDTVRRVRDRGVAVVLISHRYDPVRCWNVGAYGSYYAVSPDRRHGVVHLLFYADRGPTEASVRIAGRWRSVRMLTLEGAPAAVDAEFQEDAVEVHLPRVPQYVALELNHAV